MNINFFNLNIRVFIFTFLSAILSSIAFIYLRYELIIIPAIGMTYILVSRLKVEVNLILAIFLLMILDYFVNIDIGIAKGISFKNLILYLLFFIAFYKRKTGVMYQKTGLELFWVVFFLLQIITTFYNYLYSPYTQDSQVSEVHMKRIIDFLLLILTLGNLNLDRHDIRAILKYIFLITAFVSLLNTVMFLSGVQVRDMGVLGDANKTAIFLAIIIPFGLHMVLTEKESIKQWFYLVCLFFPILNIIFALSRGGMICAVLAITIMASKKLKDIKMIFVSILSALIIFGAINFLLPDKTETMLFQRLNPSSIFFAERQQKDKGRSLISSYTSGRTFLWEKAVEAIKDRPFIGLGHDSYRWWLLDNYGVQAPTHNAYLSISASYGLFAGLIFLFIIIKLFKDSLTYSRKKVISTNVYIASLAAYSVGIFSITYPYYYLLLIISSLMYLEANLTCESPIYGKKNG